MTKKTIVLAVLIIFTLISPYMAYAANPKTNALWEKVSDALNDGLPQTAIESLKEIHKAASAEKRFDEAIKAVCKQITLEAKIKGGRPEEKILRLGEEIEKSAPEMKPIMKTILAQWYWQYFMRNKYRFLNRAKTAGLSETDFTTWDLPKIFGKISKLYIDILKDGETLKKIKISDYYGLIEKGGHLEALRPTLFDFIAYEALTFYMAGEQAAAEPQDAFIIRADSDAFAEASKFMTYKPETSDTESSKLMAIGIFQKLMEFHKNDDNKDAFIDCDIHRLNYVKNVAAGGNVSALYIKRMKEIAAEYKKSPISALASYHVAAEYNNKENYVEAVKICDECIAAHPNTEGANNCLVIKNEILSKSLEISGEKSVPSNAVSKISAGYKNIESVTFRIYKDDWRECLDDYATKNLTRINVDVFKIFMAQKPVKEWTVALKPTADFKQARELIDIPALPCGFYRIFASVKKDFSIDYKLNDNIITGCTFWVSDIALATRTQNGAIEGFVLEAVSGEPVKNADVKIYSFPKKSDYKKRVYEITRTTATNDNGMFSSAPERGGMVYASDGKNSEFLNSHYLSASSPYIQGGTQRAVFFTDRAIYRPGQTINFKGICIKSDGKTDDYSVIPNKQFKVTLFDVSHQRVEEISIKTNDYGSFSGSVTVPAGHMPGVYRLSTTFIHGSCDIRVEEYKRPKFSVELKQPAEGFKLGDSVKIEGEALAYTGSPIDSASVHYRVTREARMPRWYFLFWGGYDDNEDSSAREIASGFVKTGTDGKFAITFNAAPDETISKTSEPTFIYTITADVTDGAGETRSNNQSICLGYTALEAVMNAEPWQTQDAPVKISADTRTLDGKPIAAEGVIEIFALKQPEKPVRSELTKEFDWRFTSVFENKSKAMDEGTVNSSDYAFWPLDKKIESKPFNTDGKTPASLEFKLKTGAYKAVLSTNDRFGNKVKTTLPIMVIDTAAPALGVKTPEYFVTRSNSVEVGDKFLAYWGTGYEKGRVFVEIIRDNKTIKNYWTTPGNTAHFIEFPVTEDLRGGFTLMTTFLKENRLYTHDVNVNVPWSNKKYEVKFETFRSKLIPGQEETWSVKVKGPGAELKAAEFLAAMYDESLDAFTPHKWSGFDFIFRRDRTDLAVRFANSALSYDTIIWASDYDGSYAPRVYPSLPYDIIQAGGYDYFGGRHKNGKKYKMRANDISLRSRGDAPAVRMSLGEPEAERAVSKKAAAPMQTEGLMKDEEPESASTGKTGEAPSPDLSKVQARRNLNETAFFYPSLLTGPDGSVKITFKMPEALTKWHFMGFAHGKNLESGFIEEHAVTQKDLMVQPNPPRFLREGDAIEFCIKVTNMADKEINGSLRFTLADPVSEKPLDKLFENNQTDQNFTLPPSQSKSLYFKLTVPDGVEMLKFKAVAAAGAQSDGEEGVLPVLGRRIAVHESIQLPVKGPQEKKFKFEKLAASAGSGTLKHLGFTVQMCSNPAWYAVQALPYLMEYPHECSEQVFNRLYANALAKHIADSDPKIRRVFDLWKGGQALKSNLEKNAELKSVLLLETPWVLDAKNETQAKQNAGILFDNNRLTGELDAVYEKLKNMQCSDGAWPWFPGGEPNSYITLYIVAGFGRLKNIEVNKPGTSLALDALNYLDRWLDKTYRDIIKDKRQNDNNLTSTIALYLYGRNFFLKEKPVLQGSIEAYEYFVKQAKTNWLSLGSRMSQAHVALALNRIGDAETPKKIMASFKERSQSSEELGMYWSDTELSWWWYHAPIETQALMIEAFSEITRDEKAVEECKVWLLKQKQTTDWKTTKATADAIYALLGRGANLLASDALVEVTVGGRKVEAKNVEAGTGFYEKRYEGSEIKPEFGEITVKKTDPGVAWGGAHWRYLEDMSKITPHAQNPLTLKKSVFVGRDSKSGPVIEPVNGPLAVGDLITIRVELRTDRDMEYVHMKDQRGSGLEPVNVLSRYKYQDGLRYYEATKDSATHFYIDYLPKGTYVFEYQLRVQNRGKYQNGMAHIECMYAPEFNSHSDSVILEVK